MHKYKHIHIYCTNLLIYLHTFVQTYILTHTYIHTYTPARKYQHE